MHHSGKIALILSSLYHVDWSFATFCLRCRLLWPYLVFVKVNSSVYIVSAYLGRLALPLLLKQLMPRWDQSTPPDSQTQYGPSHPSLNITYSSYIYIYIYNATCRKLLENSYYLIFYHQYVYNIIYSESGHWITLCKINIIKTGTIDGYII